MSDRSLLDINFSGEVWLYAGKGGWHFVTLGKKVTDRVARFIRGDSSAWGSVKVTVKVGDYSWQTSIFPDSKLGSYLLPLKKQVRRDLNIESNSKINGMLFINREESIL